MDGSHFSPEAEWLEKVRELGQLIRQRRYDEPHARHVADLMRGVIARSTFLVPAHRFEYLRVLHHQVVHGALSVQHGPTVELLLINELLSLCRYNDEYSRFLIHRKRLVLQQAPWLGAPGEAAYLDRALKKLTPPSRNKRAAYFLLKHGINYYFSRHRRRRAIRK